MKNCCNCDSLNGKFSYVKSTASIVDGPGNAVFMVQSFWRFTSKYSVIDLANARSYAVVGRPVRDHLWTLLRTPLKAGRVIDSTDPSS